jgi:DNA-binding NarL/FixJ family response regulator
MRTSNMETKRPSALLVDSNQESINALVHDIESFDEGFDVVVTQCPAEALSITQATHPDLIIIDWKILQTSGSDLLQLPKDVATLIVLDEHNCFENVKWAIKAGATGYICRPFDVTELWVRVNTVLHLMQAYRTIKSQKDEMMQQSKLLEHEKNRELSSKALEIDHKNRILKAVKAKLEELVPRSDDEIKAALKEVTGTVKTAINDKQHWESFRLYFEKVHPGFFSSLRDRFSKLTLEDIKYCAYLKMQMSNREIANLLNINQESVRVHKYRLKKKMALTKEIDLQKYIGNLTAEVILT